MNNYEELKSEALILALLRVKELEGAIECHKAGCDGECVATEDEMIWEVLHE